MTSLKGEDVGWLLIDVVNKDYVPAVGLNSEYFKQQETPIKFGFLKGVLLGMKKNQQLA